MRSGRGGGDEALDHAGSDEPARCDLVDDYNIDPARIVACTPLAPRRALTVVVLSNLAGIGVSSG